MTQEAAPQAEEVNKAIFQFSGRNLTSGSEKIPIIDFIGRGSSWNVRKSTFRADEYFMVFHFDQVQVIEVRPDSGPYPFDIATLELKHSTAERSGFGFFQSSVNTALGMSLDESDLDRFLNQTWHIKAVKYNWGKIENSKVADAEGNTWGEIWKAELYTAPAAPAVTPTVAATTATVPAGTAPTAVAPATDSVMEKPTDEAYRLINGKTAAEFMPAVVNSAKIKEDTSLFPGILDNTWIAGEIQRSKITLDTATGIHTVVLG